MNRAELELSHRRKLTDSNDLYRVQNSDLTVKSSEQAKLIKNMMQDRRFMLEVSQRQEALLEKMQTETREQKDSLAASLKDLTLTLTSLQNEAEQAAAAFREAAEPASTGYQSEHEKLRNQLRNIHNEQATCNNAIDGDVFQVEKNKKGQWTMRNNKGCCVAYDPDPKASAIDCEWQRWDINLMMFVGRGRVSKLPQLP